MSGDSEEMSGERRLAHWARSARIALEKRLPVPRKRRRVMVGALVLVLLTLSFGSYLTVDVVGRLPSRSALSSVERMPEATVVYDAFDRPAFTIFREQRLRAPFERLSPHLIDAVLAIEDRRFYEHGGIDLVRVVGAAVANLRAGRIVEGGSTITQQLARQSLLSTERSLGRKIAEVLTSAWLELNYEKEEILELYLNQIYFGSGFHGVETAARGYFGKPAAALGLSEAALLAGLIQAPERYSPKKFPARAVERRNLVLQVMAETGVIDSPAYFEASGAPLSLNDGLKRMGPYGSYFEEEVRRELVELFGWHAVYERGLDVYSTIDPSMQRAAEETLEAGLREIESRDTYRHSARDSEEGDADYLQGALIALDPVSGEVRALVGGRDFADSPFNRATQARRQPGSAFKPILYAAALEQGITPATVLDDLSDPMEAEEGAWLPAEGHDEYSALSVRASIQVSSNRAAVSLVRRTGVDRVVDYAARFGLGPQPRVPSVALGSGSATLEELTAAYAAFANGGSVPPAFYIRRVIDADGNVVFDVQSSSDRAPRRAVSSSTAFIMASLLRSVLDSGTGWSVREAGFRAPAGGKTGTTDDYKDAWFIGFTPELAAGVWIGFDQPRTIVSRGFGSYLAAPVWARFMNKVDRNEAGWIERPRDVIGAEICAESLALATDACRRAEDTDGENPRRRTYVEYFVSGTEPVERCSLHRSLVDSLLAPFRISSSRSSSPESAPLEPDSTMPSGVAAGSPSVSVAHDHVFGGCAGRLFTDDDGLHYVSAHEDAFVVPFIALAPVSVDVDSRHIRVSVRGGRTYNFRARPEDREALLALKSAVDPN